MEARATLRYARISPRKVSIVMDLIRNKPLAEAQAILQYTPKEMGYHLSVIQVELTNVSGETVATGTFTFFMSHS